MPNQILQGYGSDPLVVTQGYLSAASTSVVTPRSCLNLLNIPRSITVLARSFAAELAAVPRAITLELLGCGGVLDSSIANGLLAHWRLDEASGTRYDSVGTNHLTSNNGVTSGSGILGNAAAFNYASMQYLSCSSNAVLQKGDVSFSFAAWVYMTQKTHFHFIVAKDGLASGQREYLAYYDKDIDRYCAFVFRPTDVGISVAANNFGSPALNQWHFIYVEHNASADTLTIRVNDGTPDTVSTGGALQTASNAEFQIGGDARFPTQYHMAGRIDSVSLWGRILTSDEQAALYNAGVGLEYPFG